MWKMTCRKVVTASLRAADFSSTDSKLSPYSFNTTTRHDLCPSTYHLCLSHISIVVGIFGLIAYSSIPTEGNASSLLVSSFGCQRRQHQLLDHADHRIRAEGRPLASYSNKPIYHPSTSITHQMPSFKCIACLEKFTSAAEFKTHKRECRANRLAYLKIRAIRLDPKGKCSYS
jgi:hypothetical protein